MSTQHTVVGFENYRIDCVIGIEPHERITEQTILVDLKVEVDCSLAISSESIHDTMDYMLLAFLCKEMAQQGGYQLMETYISDVLEKIVNRFDLHWAWMRVKKPSALEGADYTYVEMRKEAK